jgi:hypothetical protein
VGTGWEAPHRRQVHRRQTRDAGGWAAPSVRPGSAQPILQGT